MPEPGGRSWLPGTIRELAIAFAAASALVTIVLGGGTYYVVHGEIERQIDRHVEIETHALLDYHRDHGFAGLVDVIRARTASATNGRIGYLEGVDESAATMGYIVTDTQGRRRAGALRADMPPPGWSEFIAFVRPDGSRGIAQGMNSQLPGGGRLLVAADRENVDQIDLALLWLFSAAFGTLVLLGTTATILFGRIVRQRLSQFEASAKAVIGGDIAQRMPRDGSGVEFDRLAIVLNEMLERISGLVTNLREVSTGLAHDLRTPLSRLRVRIEKAETNAADPAHRALLGDAIGDADDLLRLFESLLAIAEIDGRHIRNRFVQIDLAQAVVEIAEAHRPAIEDAGLSLVVSAAPVAVSGDRPLLQRAIGNLLDNALHHTSMGTAITVRVERAGAIARIRVADNGPGVPSSERERIFERLVRLDPSRSRPGHGLGLGMVAAIASAHDGQAKAVDSETGLAIELTLPAVED